MVKTRQGWVLLSPQDLLAVEAVGGVTSASAVGGVAAASAVGRLALASAVPGVASSTSGKPSVGLGTALQNTYARFAINNCTSQ
eukprot:g9664.t1